MGSTAAAAFGGMTTLRFDRSCAATTWCGGGGDGAGAEAGDVGIPGLLERRNYV